MKGNQKVPNKRGSQIIIKQKLYIIMLTNFKEINSKFKYFVMLITFILVLFVILSWSLKLMLHFSQNFVSLDLF